MMPTAGLDHHLRKCRKATKPPAAGEDTRSATCPTPSTPGDLCAEFPQHPGLLVDINNRRHIAFARETRQSRHRAEPQWGKAVSGIVWRWAKCRAGERRCGSFGGCRSRWRPWD